MFHVVLVSPQIPPNTGNAIRLCANTGCTLHLVRPLGFDMGSAALRRAGLDYDELAIVQLHASLADCLSGLPRSRVFAIETGGTRPYSAASFHPGDVFLFGGERRGLPAAALEAAAAECRLHIPMRAGNRSLNLSNAVALVVYEAWRQNQFVTRSPT
jgi:tRNA (cytidine/uridine-2'-O-)-methyltransferase